jgi:hypothetical protein
VFTACSAQDVEHDNHQNETDEENFGEVPLAKLDMNIMKRMALPVCNVDKMLWVTGGKKEMASTSKAQASTQGFKTLDEAGVFFAPPDADKIGKGTDYATSGQDGFDCHLRYPRPANTPTRMPNPRPAISPGMPRNAEPRSAKPTPTPRPVNAKSCKLNLDFVLGGGGFSIVDIVNPPAVDHPDRSLSPGGMGCKGQKADLPRNQTTRSLTRRPLRQAKIESLTGRNRGCPATFPCKKLPMATE